MQSRAMRLLLGALCVIAVGGAAFFIYSLEQPIVLRRAALVDFDVRAREATDLLADLRVAQQAYVAPGQGVGFWMPKVDTASKATSSSLARLQQSAVSSATRSELDQAVAGFIEFSNVDARIRDYLKGGSHLMAADIIFTEGGEAAAATARHIELARLGDHLAFDVFEADGRKRELAAVAGAAASVLVIVLLLAVWPARAAQPTETESKEAVSAPATPDAASARPVDLDLRQGGRPAAPQGPDAPRVEQWAQSVASSTLMTAAQVCTDISRVREPEQLQALLARTAEVLNASGLLLWLASDSGDHLRPTLAYGYAPQVVSRIPALHRSANNATAAAYRAAELQVVRSRPGASGKGAIVAPLLSADGCVGVLAAEIRDGGETSDGVQALAGILAAQLAAVVAAAPAATEALASGAAGL